MTDSGQMIVPCAFARTGEQLYTAGQLNLADRDANEIITVHRSEDQVFADKSMETFRSVPVTIGHPKTTDGKPMPVTVDNADALQVGQLEGMPHRMEDQLCGTIVLSSKAALDSVDDGVVELSAGYQCDIEVRDDGSFHQVNIRANHIAIVDKGRAGSSCRLSDEALLVVDEMSEEDKAKVVVVEDADLNAMLVLAKSLVEMQDKANENASKLKESISTVAQLTEDNAAVVATHKQELADEVAKTATTVKFNDEAVEKRCKILFAAKHIADMEGFEGKTDQEVQLLVIADQMPDMNLEGKDAGFIDGVFAMVEDASNKETPMSKLLGNHLHDAQKDLEKKDKPAPTLVADAQARAIARNSHK